MRAFLILALSLFTAAGCTPKFKSRMLANDFNYEEAKYRDIEMASFDIVDERDNGKPELNEEHRELIRGEVLKHLGAGRPFAVKVYLKEGEKSLQSKGFKRREQVKAAVRVELSGEKRTVGAGGEASYEVSSPSASDEYREKLYQKAIRVSIHQAFVSLKSGF